LVDDEYLTYSAPFNFQIRADDPINKKRLGRIPVKIVVFNYDAGIVTTLSNRYDECSRPLKGFFVPRMGDKKIQ